MRGTNAAHHRVVKAGGKAEKGKGSHEDTKERRKAKDPDAKAAKGAKKRKGQSVSILTT